MCWKVQCTKCQLYTWSGCGEHKEEVMSQIPMDQRCICNKQQNNDINNDDDVKIESKTNISKNTDILDMIHSFSNATNTLTLLYELTGHEDRVWCCSWNPNKDILATTSGDKTIKLWAQSSIDKDKTFKCIQTLDAHTRTVRCISWHPSGNMFASASFDGTIGIWKKKCFDIDGILRTNNELEFECIDLLEGHDNEVKSLSWDPSGKLLASCSRDKSVWIWELDDDNDENNEFEVVAVKRSHDADVKCVTWHPFEQFLVSCSYDNTIKTYKSDEMDDDWFINQILKKHTSTVWNLAFNPLNGKEFVSCSDDESIVIWEQMPMNIKDDDDDSLQLVNIDEFAYKLKQCIDNIHDESIYCVDWLSHKKDGVNIIVTCSGDNSIKLLHQKLNKNNKCNEWEVFIEEKEAHKNDVNWVEFGPRIKPGIYWIASASDDGTIKIWQLQTEINEDLFNEEQDDDDYDDDIVNEID